MQAVCSRTEMGTQKWCPRPAFLPMKPSSGGTWDFSTQLPVPLGHPHPKGQGEADSVTPVMQESSLGRREGPSCLSSPQPQRHRRDLIQ